MSGAGSDSPNGTDGTGHERDGRDGRDGAKTALVLLGPPEAPTDVGVPTVALTVTRTDGSALPGDAHASLDGAARSQPAPLALPVRIGTHPSNDFVLAGSGVSRFHCELRLQDGAVIVRDSGSTNGTFLDGVRVLEAHLRHGSSLALGAASLRVDLGGERVRMPLSEREAFGDLLGSSPAMRSAIALLERAAPTDVTVLLEGETGTGKEAAATGLHEHSARRDGPLVVVDCGAIPEALLESELFGHEKGAFTGADRLRIGAFEAADGGTLFLDEIGELPPALQPKLLRALEDRTVRRVGSHGRIPTDIRLIAATNRRLDHEVNEGAFRSDLYYRLAVLRIELPPLRQRPDDIPQIAASLLTRLGASTDESAALLTRSFLTRLGRAAWPGNVRELRNHLERCLVMQEPLPLGSVFGSGPVDGRAAQPGGEPAGEPAGELGEELPELPSDIAYAEARRRALAAFEHRWLPTLLDAHEGNVSAAARAAGMDRVYLHRLLRKHRLR